MCRQAAHWRQPQNCRAIFLSILLVEMSDHYMGTMQDKTARARSAACRQVAATARAPHLKRTVPGVQHQFHHQTSYFFQILPVTGFKLWCSSDIRQVYVLMHNRCDNLRRTAIPSRKSLEV
jgi:hypothetical protein